jgi:uncharacterized protein YndB with AHSA1/START domain
MTTYTDDELAQLDSISRQIDIDAPAAKVWDLVCRPGWYVNDGTIYTEADMGTKLHYRTETDPQGRQVDVLEVTGKGEFRFRTVELDEPRYAAFRWMSTPWRGPSDGTLVEFWIDERPGGVTLRVKESGFSTLAEDPADWLKEREGNDKGWNHELAAGKTWVEARR